MNKIELTNDDIKNLIKSPIDKRLDITRKIAHYYNNGGFDSEQRLIAEQIFRVLVKDTENEIRKSLSETIKNSNKIPKDVVMALAKDIKDIALPVLEFSDVFTDADLVEIIHSTKDEAKHISVSHRKNVSEEVSGALVETHNENVVDSLLHNEGASLSEKDYSKIIDDFSDKETLMEAIVERDRLPTNVIEILTKKVSKEIISKLAEKHENISQISEEIGRSEEAATMKAMGMRSTEQEYYNFKELMKKLHISENLMPISALCVGNLNLFEICMARAISIPVLNVRKLLYDNSNKGFRVMYARAELPESLAAASEVLVTVLRDMKDELNNVGIELSKPMAKKILASLAMRADEVGEVENIDYIITLIRHNAKL